MKILLITTGPVASCRGGAERVFCNLANRFAEWGLQVTALYYDENHGMPLFFVNDAVDVINCHHVDVFGNLLFRFLRQMARFIPCRCWRRIYRQKIKSDYEGAFFKKSKVGDDFDVVLTFQPESTYIYRHVMKGTKPIISAFHAFPEQFFRLPEFDMLSEYFDDNTTIQVLLPEYVQKVKERFPQCRVVSIPNEVPQYTKLSSLSTKRVLNVARLDSLKQQDALIEVFCRLTKDFPEWHLDIYGGYVKENRYVRKLINIIDKFGLQGRVKIHGETDDVYSVLLETSVFCLPSKYEGFPLALTEAMAAGIPCVGLTTCAGVNSLIRSGKNGILTNDFEGLELALRKLMSDEEYRESLGRQAHLDMRHYSAENIKQQWLMLVEEIVC